MPDTGLNILWASVARVLPQEAPRPQLAVVGVQAAELRLRRPAVIHASITRQDPTPKRVDHVLLRVHAHLQEEQFGTVNTKCISELKLIYFDLNASD